jgi:peptidoglycan/LPS O-acetylase OafA/YrhL
MNAGSLTKTLDRSQPLLQQRMQVLDGVRGLAILLVMAYHYKFLRSFAWSSVDLFFVLSGFLITGKILETAGRRDFYRIFYLRRVQRIVPAYYTLLFVFLVLLPLFRPSAVTPSHQQLIDTQWYYWGFALNFYNAFHGWTQHIIFVPLWSVACEMQFYLVWPLVLVFFMKRSVDLIWVLLSFVVLAMIVRLLLPLFPLNVNIARYVLMPARIDGFAAGGLLYYLMYTNKYIEWFRKGWLLASVAFVAVVCIVWQTGVPWRLASDVTSWYGNTLNVVFWTGIMAQALQPGIAESFFRQRWLMIAGKYSYGMYLLHVPVKVLLSKWFQLRGYQPDAVPAALLFCVTTLLLAMISFHLLEKRFLHSA